jgi:hypothetical protein
MEKRTIWGLFLRDEMALQNVDLLRGAQRSDLPNILTKGRHKREDTSQMG